MLSFDFIILLFFSLSRFSSPLFSLESRCEFLLLSLFFILYFFTNFRPDLDSYVILPLPYDGRTVNRNRDNFSESRSSTMTLIITYRMNAGIGGRHTNKEKLLTNKISITIVWNANKGFWIINGIFLFCNEYNNRITNNVFK